MAQTLDLSNPVLLALHEYWLSKASGGNLPGRRDIDPIEIPQILDSVFLIDVIRSDAGLRFRYRLTGTKIVQIYQNECTGMWVEDAFPEQADELIAGYTEAVESGVATHARYAAPSPGRDHITVERLICPLAADGETVDMLFGALAF
ncbi:MAG: PAS domain-containing protein [Alphaproteobacteria bacterium]